MENITIEDIRRKPDIILYEEKNLPTNFKEAAIRQNPSLIDGLTEKTDNLLQIAFERGYWNDLIAAKVDNSLYDEDSLLSFLKNASIDNINRYLSRVDSEISVEATKVIVGSHPELYSSGRLEHNDELDWIALKGVKFVNDKTDNLLKYMGEPNQEKVNYMFERFGKYALKDLSGMWQTNEIKEAVMNNNPYDYSFIEFNAKIAKAYVDNHAEILPFLMKKNKYDPFYEDRVIFILQLKGECLEFVDKQTETMQVTAINNQPLAIEFATKPSEDLCLIAARIDKNAIGKMNNVPKSVCKEFNIPYVKPSKYNKNTKYFVAMDDGTRKCFRTYMGSEVDAILDKDCKDEGLGKVKKIAKVKEILEEEEKILKKFGFFKTENPFFDDQVEE
jgi:hypothetical protein